jgi:hypothetical protein
VVSSFLNDFSSTIAALVEPVGIRFVCPFGTKLAATNGLFLMYVLNSHYSANCQNIFILIDEIRCSSKYLVLSKLKSFAIYAS